MSLFSKIKAVRVQKIIMLGSANVIGTIKDLFHNPLLQEEILIKIQ